MEDSKKDLKEEEDKTPSGDDQPEKKTPEAEEGVKTKEPSTDEVSISKSELDRLRKDAGEKDNYRKAVIRLNRKGRVLPGSEPEKKQKAADKEDLFDDKPKESEFVTKKELAVREEKRAIDDACQDEEIALNWPDIITFYQRPQENSYGTQLAAIKSAYKLWRADKGITDDSDKIAKKAVQDLASDKGLSKGKDKKPAPLKKHIIPKKSNMKSWY